MSYSDMEEFDEQIVSLENPSMQRYLLNGEPVELQHDTKYLRKLLEYIGNRKDNYQAYVPKEYQW